LSGFLAGAAAGGAVTVGATVVVGATVGATFGAALTVGAVLGATGALTCASAEPATKTPLIDASAIPDASIKLRDCVCMKFLHHLIF